MPTPSIPLKEFADRRTKVLRGLKGAVGLIFAGEQSSHLPENWRPNASFEYLTGVTDEAGAVLLLDPSNPVADRRAILFLRPLNPELEKWDGYRDEISKRLKDRTGMKTIQRTLMLPRFLLQAAIRARKLACLHALSAHTAQISPDLEVFRKLSERVPGCSIEDRSDLLADLRCVKSAHEVRMLEHAVGITARGYDAVLQILKPGISEFDVQETLEHAYRTSGSRGPLYGTIAGTGLNSTVLHYHANDQTLNDGDLICIDSAAGFGGYAADITRTYPVNGRFTKRQREVYDVVLKAEEVAIRAVKPGATFAQIDKAARDVIVKAGFGDYFIHGIGHHIGLEVHDITPIHDQVLHSGAVITVEPGVYIPDEKIGVRIEDDILVTKTGSRNLSSAIAKKPTDIEKLLSRR